MFGNVDPCFRKTTNHKSLRRWEIGKQCISTKHSPSHDMEPHPARGEADKCRHIKTD